jgi:hypothetical protein
MHNNVSIPATAAVTMDNTNEATIMYGYVVTSDGGTHTLDNTGSIGWKTGTFTGSQFSDSATRVLVGVTDVIDSAGPAARADNTTDVIDFDVSATFAGAGGGLTSNAWQTSAMTTGSKVIANGQLIAICVQMTVRGGTDGIIYRGMALGAGYHASNVTGYVGGSYVTQGALPNAIITFGDGAYGWLVGTELFSSETVTEAPASNTTPDEVGQLYSFPYPMKIHGLYANVDPDGDFELVLYRDPLNNDGLGLSAVKTVAVDANRTASATGRRIFVVFDSPYTTTANQVIAAVIKPTTTTAITVYKRTIANAAHRITEIGGTSSYGVSRTDAGAAFANVNSSLTHYYVGLMAASFDDGVQTGGGGARMIGL